MNYVVHAGDRIYFYDPRDITGKTKIPIVVKLLPNGSIELRGEGVMEIACLSTNAIRVRDGGFA